MLSIGTSTDDVGAMALTKEEFATLARSLFHSESLNAGAAQDRSHRPGHGSRLPHYRTPDLSAIGEIADRSTTSYVSAARTSRRIVPAARLHHHTMALTIGLLLASSGAAAIAWTTTKWTAFGGTSGDTIARWTPGQLLASFLPPESGQSRPRTAPSVAEVAATKQVHVQEVHLPEAPLPEVPAQPVASQQAASSTELPGPTDVDAAIPAVPVAPLPWIEFSQPLDPIANQLATAKQEIQQLKTNQQQLFRDMTMVFDTIASIKADKASAQLMRTKPLAQTARPAQLRTRAPDAMTSNADPSPPQPPMPLH